MHTKLQILHFPPPQPTWMLPITLLYCYQTNGFTPIFMNSHLFLFFFLTSLQTPVYPFTIQVFSMPDKLYQTSQPAFKTTLSSHSFLSL